MLFVVTYFALNAQTRTSHFIEMPDGVKLAADVYLPQDYKSEALPTLVLFERYWRSSIDVKTGDTSTIIGQEKFFSDHGYIIVIVDTRGTGASFGTRQSEYSPLQVADSKTVLDWIVDQSWSNGKVGSYGVSYSGTTAELLCATQHPALKAVIPGWSDFDLYRSPARPYGMLASTFVKRWGFYVKLLDRNRSLFLRSAINPVVSDSLNPALKEHKGNLDVYRYTRDSEFRNSAGNGLTYEECSVVHWQKEIEASEVPMFIMASWMDAGTAEGAIQRLEHFSNPQKVLLMSTSHGAGSNANPFTVGDTLFYPIPSRPEQSLMMLEFFDHYVKGEDKGVEDWPLIQYYNIGENEFRESDVWPIEGSTDSSFYFQSNQLLSQELIDTSGKDSYTVDFDVATSEFNRWTTQMEGGVLGLNRRQEMDERMLTYTSQPLRSDMQITGTPEVQLYLSTTHEDGVVLVYLEDVAPDGTSTYLTEGGLRLMHRKLAGPTDSTFNLHTFNEEDAEAMIPNQAEKIHLRLLPTSVTIKKGHSIRIAIAGADKSIFDRCPKHGTPELTIHHSSKIVLPVILE
ncbi:MAG: CocE/NonD family hydrolase [Crocinitomicaceae bacterium]